MTASTFPPPAVPLQGAAPEPPELIIRARTGWVPVDWREIVRYHELLYFLVWRDVKVRYKQTALGVAWAVIQPVFSVLVATVIFGTVAGFNKDLPAGVKSYAVFVYASTIAWQFFSQGVSTSAQSLLTQQHLLTKVYFPRLIIPAASIGAGLVDMGVSFLVYAAMLLFYLQPIKWTVLLLPVLVGLTIVCTVGIGCLLASMTVKYRDFRYVIPFLMQALFFLSPVNYPVATLMKSHVLSWLLWLNPMAGILDAYRAAILPGVEVNWPLLAASAGWSVFYAVLGMVVFKRTEKYFADLV